MGAGISKRRGTGNGSSFVRCCGMHQSIAGGHGAPTGLFTAPVERAVEIRGAVSKDGVMLEHSWDGVTDEKLHGGPFLSFDS